MYFDEKELLTKEKFIELLSNAKQDEHGHFYIEGKPGIFSANEKIYFTLTTTICDDFVEEYVYVPERDDYDKPGETKNSYRYDRHFTSNDDTFECFLVKGNKLK